MPNNAPTDDSIRTVSTADAIDGYTNDDSPFPLRDNNTTTLQPHLLLLRGTNILLRFSFVIKSQIPKGIESSVILLRW